MIIRFFNICKSGSTRGESGFALVAVIWIGMLLAMAAAVLTGSARGYLRSTEALVASAEAQASADAGASIAILTALQAQAGGRSALVVNGNFVTCRLLTGDNLALRLRDEAGRVDLNIGGIELLTALLAGLGLPPEEAKSRAEAIVDYRDGDAVDRNGASETTLYTARGYGPKNAPFTETEEVSRVPGFDGDLARRIAPFLTVHSEQDGVDPVAAVPRLIDVLRSGVRAAAGSNLEGLIGVSETANPFAIQSARRAVRIDAEAVTSKGARYVREAIVQFVPALAPDRREGESRSRSQTPGIAFRILRWRRGEPSGTEVRISDAPQC